MQAGNYKNFKQMDPDFGRAVTVGEGFGEISKDEYSQLVTELNEEATLNLDDK